MATDNRAAVFSSLRAKLLISFSAVVLLAIGALTGAWIVTIRSLSTESQTTAGQSLLTDAQNRFLGQNRDLAMEMGRLMKQVEHDLSQFTVVLGAAVPEDGTEPSRSGEADNLHTLPGGQQVNDPSELSGVFISNTVRNLSPTIVDVNRSAVSNSFWTTVAEDNASIRTIYFAMPSEMLRIYPNLDLAAALPADFKPTVQDWYAANTPENNPDRLPRWIPAHTSSITGEQVITLSQPIYTPGGEFVGVAAIDLSLDRFIGPIQESQILPGSYSFLVDNQGRAVGLPEQGFNDILGRSPRPNETVADLREVAGAFTPLLAKILTTEQGVEEIEAAGQRLTFAFNSIHSSGWSVGTTVESNRLSQETGINEQDSTFSTAANRLIATRLLPITLAVLISSLFLSWLIAHRTVKPITTLAGIVEKVASGDWQSPILYTRNDEIGKMESSLETLRNQYLNATWDSAKQMAEQNQKFERWSVKLQAAVEVGQAAASEGDLDSLLEQVAELISQKFGYYHVGILVNGEKSDEMVLRAANSPGYQNLIESGYRLQAGEQGTVWLAVTTGELQVSSFEGAEGVIGQYPYLSETRSELAIPLICRGGQVGVLDLHSKHEEAISKEELAAMKLLADQVAIAIQNAELVEELQARLERISNPPQPSRYGEWRHLASGQILPAYEYNSLKVAPAANHNLGPEVESRLQAGEMVVLNKPEDEQGKGESCLLAPIRLLGKTIGVIGFESDNPEQGWGPEQLAMIESLTGQAALALENARLLEEARQRAENERLISEVTCRIRETLDIDKVLQTAAHEIQQRLNLQEVTIRLGEN
jgi:GAF domain-containing protein/HAMP domain-containing protein